ncbi:NAD-dependent epimerase/dehydratase family protein [Legionella micdadei]|uniref:dTDP-glucose 4,6-dehydratase n=1 Tax=Legionella micdadei TaxID=451 RepID=A0A098GLF5_LEGMI|nr:NAD-dependent epimerase/dehydratase family protein [Legionella micdadei]ARG98734.1 epimerase [Legionella micdadei]ARH01453.1 epimerase [Legionella micdadei]KTD28954.1 NAD-dependent epimerase/dehydratase [Legionella micdadei]NSL17166.1 NAD-dependent epimerase/dehydratase family protein [Legionella micdadei]CEG62336.1 dTDP-glucose 4,6-dehydratase [Legionella micdadei]
MKNPLANDLDYVLSKTSSFWEELRNQRIFITGGTGFFGCWLLESFLWINKKLDLNAEAYVLTRNIHNFAHKYPYLYHQPCVKFYEGDVRNFTYPQGHFSHIIHAATDTNAKLITNEPLTVFDGIVQGTKHTLEFARYCKAKKFLLVSSGAVYGKQPSNVTHMPESYPSLSYLTDTKSTYALGKCTAEHLGYLYASQYGLDIKIARCFAFVGPYLPLDGHFAIGNFIRNGLDGEPIQIKGDGTPFRSYLYTADLAIWLWTVLFKGKTAYPYNVGSDEDYSLLEVAHRVAEAFANSIGINVMQPKPEKSCVERYVPDISRARTELQLTPHIKLMDAINLTKEWYAKILYREVC